MERCSLTNGRPATPDWRRVRTIAFTGEAAIASVPKETSPNASVAELVDAVDSKPTVLDVRVRVPLDVQSLRIPHRGGIAV